MSDASVAPGHARWPITIAVAALASLGLWFALAPRSERAAARGPAAAAEGPIDEPSARAAASPAAGSPLADPAVDPEASDVASPTPPHVVGADPDDPPKPGMLPHPLDDARKRIESENQLIQALNDAMSFRKAAEMRALLSRYRALDPTDVDAHQRGYGVIADCIEFPGEPSLAAAQEFYATERHSPLRRFVRRTCFEGSN